MDKRALIAAIVILSIPIILLVIWAIQGKSMEEDFIQALRTGTATGLHRDLQNKRWSSAELSAVEVLKIPAGSGRERALVRAVHSHGRVFLSSSRYAYQGTIRDSATDIVHVFGYRRSDPRGWKWERIHPDSMQAHVQQRVREFNAAKRKHAADQETERRSEAQSAQGTGPE